MKVMEFLLTLMVWGVIEDDPEPEQQQNTSSEAQTDQPALVVVEDSGDEVEEK
nr:unnamed protein product [Meloidogyne enterolobii]